MHVFILFITRCSLRPGVGGGQPGRVGGIMLTAEVNMAQVEARMDGELATAEHDTLLGILHLCFCVALLCIHIAIPSDIFEILQQKTNMTYSGQLMLDMFPNYMSSGSHYLVSLFLHLPFLLPGCLPTFSVLLKRVTVLMSQITVILL